MDQLVKEKDNSDIEGKKKTKQSSISNSITIRATSSTINGFRELKDEEDITLGDLLERSLDLYIKNKDSNNTITVFRESSQSYRCEGMKFKGKNIYTDKIKIDDSNKYKLKKDINPEAKEVVKQGLRHFKLDIYQTDQDKLVVSQVLTNITNKEDIVDIYSDFYEVDISDKRELIEGLYFKIEGNEISKIMRLIAPIKEI